LARSIILWSVFATVLFLFLSSSASVSPGDEWAFGPDTRVTPEPGYRYGLSVSGDIAVWEEEDFVYLKNLTNADPAQILAGDADKPATLPYIDGNLVAWQQDGKVCWQILGGASSCIESSVYSEENPSPMVSNGRIVWADWRNGNADIYLYDVNTGSEQDIYVGPGEQTEPFMDGDWVVWEDFQNDTSEIMAYNLATGQSLQISDDSNLDFSPSGGGNWVAYLENTGININDVWLYNLGTGQRLLLDGGNSLSWGTPHIEGNLVVWNRWDWHVQDAHSQIYLCDLINGNTYTISDGSSDATHPVISAGRIIWFDDRNRERGNTVDLYYVTADNAQALVDRFRPEFKFMIDENFFPAPIEQLLTADGTSLQKKDDPDYNPIFNPTAHDLANYCSSPDCFIDLWGPSVWTGGGPDSCSINWSFVNFFIKATMNGTGINFLALSMPAYTSKQRELLSNTGLTTMTTISPKAFTRETGSLSKWS
jgi:beta propeller repeat protein